VSVVCNPRSIVEPSTPFVVSLTSPCCVELSTEAETNVLPSSVVMLVRLVAISVAKDALKLAVAAANSASVA